jgi:hypothetical protein
MGPGQTHDIGLVFEVVDNRGGGALDAVFVVVLLASLGTLLLLVKACQKL